MTRVILAVLACAALAPALPAQAATALPGPSLTHVDSAGSAVQVSWHHHRRHHHHHPRA